MGATRFSQGFHSSALRIVACSCLALQPVRPPQQFHSGYVETGPQLCAFGCRQLMRAAEQKKTSRRLRQEELLQQLLLAAHQLQLIVAAILWRPGPCWRGYRFDAASWENQRLKLREWKQFLGCQA